MQPETFDSVAARFERLSLSRPRLYRLFVASLGLFGFAFLGAWVVGLGALCAYFVAVGVNHPNVLVLRVAVAVGLIVLALLRAIWVKLERPTGIRITPEEAPALFEEIEQLRALGGVPRLHRVLVDERLNAAVMQTPRLGILGWTFNDLVLGYPLLASVSADELRAILAHELGHLSGRHGRVAAWTYRMRRIWSQILAALEQRRSFLTGVFRWFLSLYGPWFSAASLALVRAQEREADRFSARATSSRIAADALVAVRVADWALDRHLIAPLKRSVAQNFEPPHQHLARLEDAVREGLRDPGAEVELARALRERSHGTDTHPSLAERVSALGETPRVAPRPAQSALALLPPDLRERIRGELEQAWRSEVAQSWLNAHQKALGAVARLRTLDEQSRLAAPRVLATLERALLIERFRGAEEALPLLRNLAATAPHLAQARFHTGRLLLEAGDPEGVAHLERAMELDPAAESEGMELIARHLLSLGKEDQAAGWLERLEKVTARERKGELERSSLGRRDVIEPHRLGLDMVNMLVSQLRGDREIKRAYLGRKRLESSPGRPPVFVLAVVPARPFWRPLSSAARAALARRVAERVTGPVKVFVVVDSPSMGGFVRRVSRMEGTAVL